MLELCGAVLGLKLAKSIANVFKMGMREVILWTDGMNVLYWIRKQSWLFKCFVVNRVRKTQAKTELFQWRYALTKCNLENRITREMAVKDIENPHF